MSRHLPKAPEVHDPGHVFLRRAFRLAITFTFTLALLWKVLDFPTSSVLYGCFGVFSLTTFGDFGGPWRSRLFAYIGTIAVASVGLVFASTLSYSTVAAVAGTAVWGFLVAYAGVLRGYVAGAATCLMVPFFIAISAREDIPHLADNLTCYLIGGAIATAGTMLLWPVYTQDKVRERVAAALDAAADVIDAQDGGDAAVMHTAMDALADANRSVHEAYDNLLARPGAATSRQRHLMQLVDLLSSIQSALVWRARAGVPREEHDLALSADISKTFRDSAHALRTTGSSSKPTITVEIGTLDVARAANREGAAHWAASRIAGADANDTVDVLASEYPNRALSGLAMMAGARAGKPSGPDLNGMGTVAGEVIPVHLLHATGLQMLKANFSLRSVWCRNSIRAAFAYSLAVLVMLATDIDHAFWIALGVLAAMRFDSTGTKRTAKQVIIGNLIGFFLGGIVVAVTHDNSYLVWILLPLAVALATYTPGAVSLIVGQAAFTVFLVVLFGILEPDGFGTDIVRMEDVLLGLAVALVSSFLMWPHGARDVVNKSLLDAADAVSAAFAAAYARLRGPENDAALKAAGDAASKSMSEALDNFDLALAQSLPGGFEPAEWMRVFEANAELMLASDKVAFLAKYSQGGTPAPELCEQVIASASEEGARYREAVALLVADDLDDPGSAADAKAQAGAAVAMKSSRPADPTQAVADWLASGAAASADPQDASRTLLALTWTAATVGHIERIVERLVSTR